MAGHAKSKAAAVVSAAPRFLGRHLRGVDNGRVILPADWRQDGSTREFMVIVWPVTTREYLLVLPPSRWEVMARNLQGLSLTDERAALFERLIGSSTSMGSLDKYGRLPLPEDAAKAMGIENEAMLVGRMDKFEVWSPARFAATLANPDAQVIAEALKSMNV